MQCVNGFFRLLASFVVFFGLGSTFSSVPAHAQIDLHAHLDMKPGLGILLHGNFSEEAQSNDWSDRIYSRVSGLTLAAMTKDTRPKLIVASLYGHPYFGFSLSRDGIHFNRRENVRKAVEQEYLELLAFVREHSNDFAIARNATEARAILKQGKTVLVLSLEGAWATLESEEDFHLWVDERGLSIVTPVHLTADDLGGDALMNAFLSFVNSTLDFLKSVNATNGTCLKTYCRSVEGLTPKGQKIVDELMYRNVWLDLAHANEIEVAALVKKYEQGLPTSGSVPIPILITHTQLREFYPVERGLSEIEIDYILKHDGMVGIMPSQYMMPLAMKNAEVQAITTKLKTTPGNESDSHGGTCVSGLSIFREVIAHDAEILGSSKRITLGSDINAPVNGLSPECGADSGATANSDLQKRGFYSYSQWNALTKFVAPPAVPPTSSSWPDQTLEHFLTLWSQVRP